jgi:thiamine monophosphate synthase
MISSGIYGITDDSFLPGDLLLDGTEATLAEGVALLQYRSKHASAEDKLAKASQVHGVHLGRSDGDIGDASSVTKLLLG